MKVRQDRKCQRRSESFLPSLPAGGRYLITPMYGLTIDNVTLDDEGEYRCSGTVPNVGAAKVLKIDANVYSK